MKENLQKIVSEQSDSTNQGESIRSQINKDSITFTGTQSKIEIPISRDQTTSFAKNMAEIMVNDILSKNYGVHNIASNIESLSEDIINGNVKPFIRFNKEAKPVACAALVKLNETDIELGRAACIPGKNGGNGELMITAFNGWKNNNFFPNSEILRAEVRTAKPTKEVPGGQATQVICLKKIGFKPTAMVPMFHHGVPDRQETFLLASIIKDRVPTPDINRPLPTSIGSPEEIQMFNIFWNKTFGQLPNFVSIDSEQPETTNLEAKITGPIVEVRTSQNPNSIDEVIEDFFATDGRFALARVPMTLSVQEIDSISNQLKQSGFRLAGFEPVMENGQISIDILFGKLSEVGKRLMVLPGFIENTFSHQEEDILINNAILWRQI